MSPTSSLRFAELCETHAHDLQLVAALDWLCEKEVPIINISYGFDGVRPAHELILDRVRARSIPVCAVGNDTLASPGSTLKALSVGAVSQSGTPWDRSATRVEQQVLLAPDLFAPGVDVSFPVAHKKDEYRITSATSYAAPHLAGLFAALYERCSCVPTLEALENAVLGSCDPRLSASSPRGKPDALKAMKFLESSCRRA